MVVPPPRHVQFERAEGFGSRRPRYRLIKRPLADCGAENPCLDAGATRWINVETLGGQPSEVIEEQLNFMTAEGSNRKFTETAAFIGIAMGRGDIFCHASRMTKVIQNVPTGQDGAIVTQYLPEIIGLGN